MNGVREAMIVAGGQGTRLRPLTDTTPKPLLPFCGAPFLAGAIRRLAAIGVQRVMLVVGPDPAPFEILVADARSNGVSIEFVAEPAPLDTAGGVRSALHRMTGTFLVLNGDVLTDLDLRELVATHQRRHATATLALTRVEDTSAYGVCVLDRGRIVDFVEKPAPGTLPGQDAVNAGTYVLEPSALDAFEAGPLSFERDVFPGLVADGRRVEGVVSSAAWADLGTPQRFLAGQRLVLDGSVRWPSVDEFRAHPDGSLRGSGVVVAADAQLVAPVLLEDDVRIDGGARVGPHVTVGRGAHIASHARVSDSALFAGSHVAGRVMRLIAGNGAQVDAAGEIADMVVADGAHLATS